MARRKKRKYKPAAPPPPPKDTPEDTPKDTSEDAPKSDPSRIPPSPPPDVPPPDASEPLPHEAALSIDDRARKLNMLYWMRIILAVAAGISATFIFEPYEGEARRWASIGYMIILFAATIFVAKMMHIPLPRSDRKKIVTQALPSYVLMYLFVWVLSYTIVNASAPGFVASPLS